MLAIGSIGQRLLPMLAISREQAFTREQDFGEDYGGDTRRGDADIRVASYAGRAEQSGVFMRCQSSGSFDAEKRDNGQDDDTFQAIDQGWEEGAGGG